MKRFAVVLVAATMPPTGTALGVPTDYAGQGTDDTAQPAGS
jgi:hypothetical protein